MKNLKNWVRENLKGIIATSFTIPILLVAFVSISHVTTFYGLTNPFSWAIYLSVAIEIAALGALAGISANMGRFVYVPFLIVTFIQFVGNVFFAYSFIDPAGDLFKQWVELAGPLLETFGVDITDMMSQKRWLALISGGMLPLISLTFAHMLVKYSEQAKLEVKPIVEEITDEIIDELSTEAGKKEKEIVEKYQPYIPTQDDLNKLQELFEKKYNQTIETEVDKELEQYIDLTNEPIDEPEFTIIEVSDDTVIEPVIDTVIEPVIDTVIDTVSEPVSDTVSEIITPTPTPSEPLYFVDDEPVIEPQINRLVYSKNG
jgi:hypothetical protein